jgi:1-aminocyclopropane-1-carboxylate deaminase/D-cysteine desulfhydrase-like pyridoxal-dependent ACC family enzyme
MSPMMLTPVPRVPLFSGATPLEEMLRLRAVLGESPRLFVKRDDAISFGFGGNKTRKLTLVAADAMSRGADTLITVGGVQSNHARATAAAAAKLGMRCILIANGSRPAKPTANALLDELLGAEIEYVATREERAPAMEAAAARVTAAGGRPYTLPLGASTPLGALAFAQAIGEMLDQLAQRRLGPPDAIVHASSSGGTQAGLAAGCAMRGLPTRVIGISADDPAPALEATIRQIVAGMGDLLSTKGDDLASRVSIEVDDGFIGGGYGVPTAESQEAQMLAARNEALFVDHTYTAKALAGLIARVRAGRFRKDEVVVFWHTGGQVGLFQ